MEVTVEMDIVYPCKVDAGNDTEELRYSLRSLENIPHRNVYIVGEKPEWATNVMYLPVAQISTKHENVAMNIRTAVQCASVSNEFLLMNDDMFIMKRIERMPVMHLGFMSDVIRHYEERYPEGSRYIDSMKKLYALLVELGYDNPLSYETHTPMQFNKHHLLELLREAKGRIYQLRTYYGNLHHIGGEETEDIKIFLDSVHNPSAYNRSPEDYLREQRVLSATGGSFKNGRVGEYVRAVFEQKSRYEI